MPIRTLLTDSVTKQLLVVLPFTFVAGVLDGHIVGIKQLPGKNRYFVGGFKDGLPIWGKLARTRNIAEERALMLAKHACFWSTECTN